MEATGSTAGEIAVDAARPNREVTPDLDATGLRDLANALGHLATAPLTDLPASCDADAERIDQLAALEAIKAAADAAIARISVDFDTSQREQQARHGVPTRSRGRGVADQIALARRISPWRAARDLRLAHALTTDLPATRRHLATGATSYSTAEAI